jgi:hypothetical protein
METFQAAVFSHSLGLSRRLSAAGSGNAMAAG